MLGSVIAAFVMEDIHPKWAFLMYGIWGGIVGISCFFLSAEAEADRLEGEEDYESHFSSDYVRGQLPRQAAANRASYLASLPVKGKEGFCYNFKKNMSQLWIAL